MFVSASTKNIALTYMFNDRTMDEFYRLYQSPSFTPNDIKSYLFSILCEKTEEKILYIYNNQVYKYFILAILKNQLCSSTSPLYYSHKIYQLTTTQISNINIPQKEYEEEEEEYPKERMQHLKDNYVWNKYSKKKFLKEDVENALKKLDKTNKDVWYYSQIFYEIYNQDGGRTYRSFARETGIDHVSIFNCVKKVINKINKIK